MCYAIALATGTFQPMGAGAVYNLVSLHIYTLYHGDPHTYLFDLFIIKSYTEYNKHTHTQTENILKRS